MIFIINFRMLVIIFPPQLTIKAKAFGFKKMTLGIQRRLETIQLFIFHYSFFIIHFSLSTLSTYLILPFYFKLQQYVGWFCLLRN